MLLLLSPAKSLDFDTPAPRGLAHSLPQFPAQTRELVGLLQAMNAKQIGALMNLSEQLASLNAARYGAWRAKHTAKNSKQALLAFNGDVYDGLDAKTLKPADIAWAQDHLLLLSGLYGALRPLDWMQAYRLEMGTQLANSRGKNLYQFWGASLAKHINAVLAKDKSPVLVNLASQEYFKVIDRKLLRARVLECVFEDYKAGQYKVISFFAKRARGMMARFAIESRAKNVSALREFSQDAYTYCAAASEPDRWVFRRKI